MSGATLYDFRDLDLMHKLEAEADDEGWVETAHMARALGFDDSARNISIRLSWMRRYGMLEFDKQKHVWRLSPGGQRVITARLRAAQKRELEALPAEAMVEVMANVSHRYHFADRMTAALLRREFLFGTQPR
jgi:hypothetical protein